MTTACCYVCRLNTSKQMLGQLFLQHASEVGREVRGVSLRSCQWGVDIDKLVTVGLTDESVVTVWGHCMVCTYAWNLVMSTVLSVCHHCRWKSYILRMLPTILKRWQCWQTTRESSCVHRHIVCVLAWKENSNFGGVGGALSRVACWSFIAIAVRGPWPRKSCTPTTSSHLYYSCTACGY